MKKSLFFIIWLLCILLLPPENADAQRKNVLVINSYHKDYPWVQSHNSALAKGLANDAELSYFYMDTKRIPAPQHPARAKMALALVEESRPDLVILTDDNAIKLLARPITSRRFPVVYLGVNENPRRYVGGSHLVTGVLERPLLKRSIVFIKELLRGSLAKCLVLFDSGTTSFAILSNVFRGQTSVTFAHTQVDLELIPSFTTWKEMVLSSKDNGFGAIILGLYHTVVDENGKHVPEDEIAGWTSANSPVPVFGFWDFAVGPGKTIGGLVLAGEPQGREAAGLARRILNGASPMSVQPVTAEHGRFVFSRSEMERWGLTLPEEFIHPDEELVFVD